ncbi:hypothetical protein B0T19DRAFT_435661 [Cercophora scortea]|uniref:Uncharacterized protein n=1 Tax=Cercophora scortea TaxID=314031 RepID=A0AAE0M3Y5_9PEZI|nr:hypothetical protein B0T19DRAFT_435661 [Cercophora scortea]
MSEPAALAAPSPPELESVHTRNPKQEERRQWILEQICASHTVYQNMSFESTEQYFARELDGASEVVMRRAFDWVLPFPRETHMYQMDMQLYLWHFPGEVVPYYEFPARSSSNEEGPRSQEYQVFYDATFASSSEETQTRVRYIRDRMARRSKKSKKSASAPKSDEVAASTEVVTSLPDPTALPATAPAASMPTATSASSPIADCRAVAKTTPIMSDGASIRPRQPKSNPSDSASRVHSPVSDSIMRKLWRAIFPHMSPGRGLKPFQIRFPASAVHVFDTKVKNAPPSPRLQDFLSELIDIGFSDILEGESENGNDKDEVITEGEEGDKQVIGHIVYLRICSFYPDSGESWLLKRPSMRERIQRLHLSLEEYCQLAAKDPEGCPLIHYYLEDRLEDHHKGGDEGRGTGV